jgi:citrate lyase beta subunit
MPEIPDVERARALIEDHGLGRRIAAVDDSDTWACRPQAPGELAEALVRATLTDAQDLKGCEAQFRASFLMGCVGAWSLHPAQIDVAKKVFSPDPEEVRFAKKVIDAIPDGRGVHMIDGKMQDDATWKQCKVMVKLA